MNPLKAIANYFKGPELSEADKRWSRGFRAYLEGNKQYLQKDFKEALNNYDEAIDCGVSELGELFGNRAFCLQALEYHLEAIEDFTKAFFKEPNDSNLYFARAFSKSGIGDLHGKLADLKEAIRVSIEHPYENKSHNEGAKELGYQHVSELYWMHLKLTDDDINFCWDNPEFDLWAKRRVNAKERIRKGDSAT